MSEVPSLSERGHLNTRSVRLIITQFHGFIFFLFIGVIILIYLFIETDEELRKYGQVNYTIPHLNSTFLPFDESNYPVGLLNYVVANQTLMFILLIYFASFLTVYFSWFYFHVSKKLKNLEQWDKDYLKQTYYLVFQTIIPSGNTIGEQMLSLAKLVFPEMREDFNVYASIPERIGSSFMHLVQKQKSERELISQSLKYTVKGHGKFKEYKLDLAFKSRLGFFIVKHFKDTIVTPSEIRELIKVIKSEFGESKVFRTILVSGSYDPIFLERTSVQNLMTRDLKTGFKIDLIVEEEKGYSVLWIG
jgi:hypothetical protein